MPTKYHTCTHCKYVNNLISSGRQTSLISMKKPHINSWHKVIFNNNKVTWGSITSIAPPPHPSMWEEVRWKTRKNKQPKAIQVGLSAKSGCSFQLRKTDWIECCHSLKIPTPECTKFLKYLQIHNFYAAFSELPYKFLPKHIKYISFR